MNPFSNPITQQRGSALVVSLSILLILTILGVSAMRTTSLEEKMAGNARDTQVAFEAAEAAMRQAETYLNTIANLNDFVAAGTGGYYTSKGAGPEAWTVETNWTNAARHNSVIGYNTAQVGAAPKYIIQMVDSNLTLDETPEQGGGYNGPPIREIGVFQITTRGTGISPNSRAVIQSFFGRIQQ